MIAALVLGAAPTAGTGGPPLRQLVGQLLLVRMQGREPSAAFLQRVRTGEVGGVVLFPTNFGRGGPAPLVRALQRAARLGGQPALLVAVDQEGGIVKRLPGAPTLAPPQMRTAAVAEAQGLATARGLRAAGIDVDLAPVLDVGRGGFITPRTFGSTSAAVARVGVAFAAGLAEGGVLATAKHFPGLGYARTNTDDRPTVVGAARARLEADWAPFALAAGRGIPLVMVSTAIYPALGPRLPAALSAPVIADLRDRLGFTGVVVTDALQTPAVNAHYPTAAAAERAIAAGADLALAAGPSDSHADTDGASTSSFDALVAAARSGRLPRARLLDAYRRVLALKRRA